MFCWQDPVDNGDSDFSANDDDETDTDVDDAGYNRLDKIEDTVLAVPSHTSSSSAGMPSVSHPLNVGPSCSYGAAPFPDPGLSYPASSQVQVSGGSNASLVNLKMAPGHSIPFGADTPLEQVSRVIHQDAGMSCDGASDSVLPALHNRASLNGEVPLPPPLPAVARPSHPSPWVFTLCYAVLCTLQRLTMYLSISAQPRQSTLLIIAKNVENIFFWASLYVQSNSDWVVSGYYKGCRNWKR